MAAAKDDCDMSSYDHVSEILKAYLDECSSLPSHNQKARLSESRRILSAKYATDLTKLLDRRDPERFCWHLWSTMIEDFVKKIPEEHFEQDNEKEPETGPTAAIRRFQHVDNLLELVASTRNLGLAVDEAGKVIRCWAGSCWRDLPCLGPQMRESWNFDESKLTDESNFLPWYALNLFAALLTSRELVIFSTYGLWSLRGTLEGGIEFCSFPPLDFGIAITHMWMDIAGRTLMKDRDHANGLPGGVLWEEFVQQRQQAKESEPPDRWTFWKSRLDEITQDYTASQVTRQHASHTLRKIVTLESGPTLPKEMAIAE